MVHLCRVVYSLNRVSIIGGQDQLAEKIPGAAPYSAEHFEGQINQLKVMVDLFHIYGVAVIFDVVYNHAGGFDGDDYGLFFFDRQQIGDNNRSLYFTDHGWANGLIFAYWQAPVCGFLTDNAGFFLNEYHVDGLRHDEVRAAVENGGWDFFKNLTQTEHFVKDNAIEIAEYWRDDPIYAVNAVAQGGLGFDAFWSDGLRTSIREIITQAAWGSAATLNLDSVAGALSRKDIPETWRRIECLENHDTAYKAHAEYYPWRVAKMADQNNSRSWYGRSRARVATGLLLTGTGVPMLLMGQEFLEDKPWSDNPNFFQGTLIDWDGLTTQKEMQDHLRFTRELIWLRRRYPALRGNGINVFHIHNDNRVIAFQRWVEGIGRDVLVVASLREDTYCDHSYHIGFPSPGHWHEVFNSDIYDNYFNPVAKGNYGGITADGPPMHGLPCSAGITIPANGMIVFARDLGDQG
jgi:1,4-alpha-glucan branching enzyme